MESKKWWRMLAALLVVSASAFGLSPAGTIERAAEEEAIVKMHKAWPAYRVTDAQMVSNKLSITIRVLNKAGNPVRFKSYVTRTTRRNGSVYYEVYTPVADQ